MTDYWSRPHDPDEPVFEIPLVGPGGKPERSDRPPAGDRPPAPNWRKVAGLAAIAGLAVGIIASVVITASDDDDEAESIPTTAPLETLAPVVTPAPPPGIQLPVELPTFPVVPGTTAGDLSAYDLEAAVATNVPGDVPRRSMFSVVGSEPEHSGPLNAGMELQHTLRVVAANEPRTERDSLTVDIGGDVSTLVVDRLGPAVYASAPQDDGDWRTLEPESLTMGSGTDAIGSLFDAFVAGPITPAAIERGTVTPSDEIVRLSGGAFARRFDVEVPIADLQPYGVLLFATVTSGTVASESAPDSITFHVYVTDQPQLALVTSKFSVGEESFVLSQFFDRQPANVRIDLPEASTGA